MPARTSAGSSMVADRRLKSMIRAELEELSELLSAELNSKQNETVYKIKVSFKHLAESMKREIGDSLNPLKDVVTLSRKHDVNDKGQYLATAIITKTSINNSLGFISHHKII